MRKKKWIWLHLDCNSWKWHLTRHTYTNNKYNEMPSYIMWNMIAKHFWLGWELEGAKGDFYWPMWIVIKFSRFLFSSTNVYSIWCYHIQYTSRNARKFIETLLSPRFEIRISLTLLRSTHKNWHYIPCNILMCCLGPVLCRLLLKIENIVAVSILTGIFSSYNSTGMKIWREYELRAREKETATNDKKAKDKLTNGNA